MPNYCVNKLIVEGTAEGISTFMDLSWDKNNDEINFGGIVDPEPYKSAVNAWGTGSSLSEKIIKNTPTKVVFVFKSPWGPPTEWAKKVFKDERFNPQLNITLVYCEHGVGFYGLLQCDEDGIQDLTYTMGAGELYFGEDKFIHRPGSAFGLFYEKWGLPGYGG